MTPSSVTLLVTLILRMSVSLSSAPARCQRPNLYTNGVCADRHRLAPVERGGHEATPPIRLGARRQHPNHPPRRGHHHAANTLVVRVMTNPGREHRCAFHVAIAHRRDAVDFAARAEAHVER